MPDTNTETTDDLGLVEKPESLFGTPEAPEGYDAAPTLRLSREERAWWLRIRLLSPLSHHDPDQADKSNVSLFRRQAQHVHVRDTGRLPSQDEVDALCADFPVPEGVAPLFGDLTLPEYVASALIKTFIARYSSMEGEGLFEGMERYRRLEERFQQAAVQAGSLFTLWGHVCRTMQVPGAVGEVSPGSVRLLTLPAALGQMVLRVLAETPAPVVMIARLWSEQEKLQSKAYAEAAEQEQVAEGKVVLAFEADSLYASADTITVQVPQYSANALRHELVREPLMWHLYLATGLPFDGPLGARTALHYNGGDLKKSGSGGVFWHRKKIREAYPHLALLSGSTDAFMLGESNLRVHTWLRCKENSRALRGIGLESDVSAFDLIDRVTLTRHASRLAGQETVQTAMPFTFETLVPGTEIVARLGLTTYAQDLEVGALMTAIDTFIRLDGTLGGQSARGYGRVEVSFYECEPDAEQQEAYEAYVQEHAETLRAGIEDGTLTTGKEVISE
ncbi:MAG: hypothetical protein GVY18_05135 [Bacteroidetes bacterium]|jgi:hypothetical protein|nr:hypothetical protein [Bacteroidota bacterium]